VSLQTSHLGTTYCCKRASALALILVVARWSRAEREADTLGGAAPIAKAWSRDTHSRTFALLLLRALVPLAPRAALLFAEVTIRQALVAWIGPDISTRVRIRIRLLSARALAIRSIAQRATCIVAARATGFEWAIIAAWPTVIERAIIAAWPTGFEWAIVAAWPAVIERAIVRSGVAIVGGAIVAAWPTVIERAIILPWPTVIERAIVAAWPTVIERAIVAAWPTVIERAIILPWPTVIERAIVAAWSTVIERAIVAAWAAIVLWPTILIGSRIAARHWSIATHWPRSHGTRLSFRLFSTSNRFFRSRLWRAWACRSACAAGRRALPAAARCVGSRRCPDR